MLTRANGITTASSANVVQYWSKPTKDAGDSEEDSNLAPVVEGHAANAGTTQSGILAARMEEMAKVASDLRIFHCCRMAPLATLFHCCLWKQSAVESQGDSDIGNKSRIPNNHATNARTSR